MIKRELEMPKSSIDLHTHDSPTSSKRESCQAIMTEIITRYPCVTTVGMPCVHMDVDM